MKHRICSNRVNVIKYDVTFVTKEGALIHKTPVTTPLVPTNAYSTLLSRLAFTLENPKLLAI